jgi:hypothetical protein
MRASCRAPLSDESTGPRSTSKALSETRHWCERSVLRVMPLLFGPFTAVALLWSNLPQGKRRCQSTTPCYAKIAPTFADATASGWL